MVIRKRRQTGEKIQVNAQIPSEAHRRWREIALDYDVSAGDLFLLGLAEVERQLAEGKSEIVLPEQGEDRA